MPSSFGHKRLPRTHVYFTLLVYREDFIEQNEAVRHEFPFALKTHFVTLKASVHDQTLLATCMMHLRHTCCQHIANKVWSCMGCWQHVWCTCVQHVHNKNVLRRSQNIFVENVLNAHGRLCDKTSVVEERFWLVEIMFWFAVKVVWAKKGKHISSRKTATYLHSIR